VAGRGLSILVRAASVLVQVAAIPVPGPPFLVEDVAAIPVLGVC
jgi:hypothetical protein